MTLIEGITMIFLPSLFLVVMARLLANHSYELTHGVPRRGIVYRLTNTVGYWIYTKIYAHCILHRELSFHDFRKILQSFRSNIRREYKLELELNSRFEHILRSKVLCPREREAQSITLTKEFLLLREKLFLVEYVASTEIWKNINDGSGVRDDISVNGEFLFVDKFLKFLLSEPKLKPVVNEDSAKCSECSNESCEYWNEL